MYMLQEQTLKCILYMRVCFRGIFHLSDACVEDIQDCGTTQQLQPLCKLQRMPLKHRYSW